jgi:hypothetical protein
MNGQLSKAKINSQDKGGKDYYKTVIRANINEIVNVTNLKKTEVHSSGDTSSQIDQVIQSLIQEDGNERE